MIDTAHFAEHPDGNAPGLPSGLCRHLRYEFVPEDPDYLTAQVRQSVLWDYQPTLAPPAA